jgi:hypothetical protein
MPAGVAVAPVERPKAGLCCKAQPRDAVGCPFRADALAPRGTALHNRDGPTSGYELDSNLVESVRRDALLTVVVYSGDIESGEHVRDRNRPPARNGAGLDSEQLLRRPL